MIPRTSLCFDRGALLDGIRGDARDEGSSITVPPSTPFFDPLWCEYLHQHPGTTLTQSTFSPHQISSEFKLYQQLGHGSFGVAFRCMHLPPGAPSSTSMAPAKFVARPSRYYAIKLPVDITRDEFSGMFDCAQALPSPVQVLESSHSLRALQEKLEGQGRRWRVYSDYKHKKEYAMENFRQEMRNAEEILEPATLRLIRARKAFSDHSDSDELVGTPLRDLSAKDHLRIIAELARMQMHPGYWHIHRILHFDPGLPALISEYAHGSLSDLQDRCSDRNLHWLTPAFDPENPDQGPLAPSPLWISIAAQLAEGIDYLRTETPLAHVDLKPANVLYRASSSPHQREAHAYSNDGNAPGGSGWRGYPASFRILISDFGICYDKASPLTYPLKKNAEEDTPANQAGYRRPRRNPIQPEPDYDRFHFPGTPVYNPCASRDARYWIQHPHKTLAYQYLSYFQFFATVMDLLRIQPEEGQDLAKFPIEYVCPKDRAARRAGTIESIGELMRTVPPNTGVACMRSALRVLLRQTSDDEDSSSSSSSDDDAMETDGDEPDNAPPNPARNALLQAFAALSCDHRRPLHLAPRFNTFLHHIRAARQRFVPDDPVFFETKQRVSHARRTKEQIAPLAIKV